MLIDQDKLSPAKQKIVEEINETDKSVLAAMKSASSPTVNVPGEQNGDEKPAASKVMVSVANPTPTIPIITPTKSPAAAAKTEEDKIEDKDWELHAAGFNNKEEEEKMATLEEPKTNENTAKPPAAAAAKPAAMSTEDEDPSNGIATFIQATMGTVGETHAFCLLLYTCYL